MAATPKQKTASPVPAAPADATLQGFRDAIDAIDADIIKLLKQRSKVVEQVGHYKTKQTPGSCFIRPAREAVMLRYLKDIDLGGYPTRELLHIWRLLIGGYTNIEQDITLSVMVNDQNPNFQWVAREFFGPSSSITKQPNALKVVSDVVDDKSRVGILPDPQENDEAWWTLLVNPKPGWPKVYGCVPFVLDDALPNGFLIAKLPPEPSGDDMTMLVLEAGEAVSKAKLYEVIQKQDDKVALLSEIVAPYDKNLHLLLYRISGFHTQDSPLIQELARKLAPHPVTLTVIGAYARPINLHP